VQIFRKFDRPITYDGELTTDLIAQFASAHGYPYFPPSAQIFFGSCQLTTMADEYGQLVEQAGVGAWAEAHTAHRGQRVRYRDLDPAL
jgi:hypothetical protein